MKIAITGHTSGLGKAFYDSYQGDRLGFSRSNGFDIEHNSSRKMIAAASMNCDVFINNAHFGNSQTDMLYDMYDLWHDDPSKTIINIGSNTTSGIKSFSHIYSAQKASLEKASEQLYSNSKCNITLIRFGWLGTEKILTNVKPEEYIKLESAVKLINEIILLNDEYNIPSVTFEPKRLS